MTEDDKPLSQLFCEDMRALAHYALAPVVLALRLSCIVSGKLADALARV